MTGNAVLSAGSGVEQYEVELIHETRNWDLLLDVDVQLYSKTFRDEEYISPKKWIRRLNNSHSDPKVVLVAVGKNLKDPENRKIVGFSMGLLFLNSMCALGGFIVVDPQSRRQGIKEILFQTRYQELENIACAHGGTLQGFFVECRSPEYPSETQSMDPSVRIKIFQKSGAVLIPFQYIVPPNPEEPFGDKKYVLLSYPVNEVTGLDRPNITYQFIHDMYRSLGYGVRYVEENVTFQETIASLKRMTEQGR